MLFGIALIIVLGIGAQWLAWRFKVPSILLLLLFGFLAGPITGLLSPDDLLGDDLIFPFVSLSVGIILFEGGLSLKLRELREIGPAVRNLITIGVVATWALSALAAYFLLGFSPLLAALLGALLVVTGPTVVVPLLQHVRPTGHIGATAKWEGIMNDPIGAVLAVLMLEIVLLLNKAAGSLQEAVLHALEGLLLITFVSLGISVFGTIVLVLLLRRRLVPDFLLNAVVLMVVVVVFTVSNLLQEESGLLATTFMGIAMANQRYVPVHRIIEFKEDLRVLLIGTLFILLSARLSPTDLQYLNAGSVIFLVVLVLVIRPVAVMLSALGTNLTGKEQAFLAWLAPRGIVAAAVASVFSFRLAEVDATFAQQLTPLVFLIIVGTVGIYGLTITPLARWLGLAEPNPKGVLFIGAHTWARQLAQALQQCGISVLMVDTNSRSIKKARQDNLPAQQANMLSAATPSALNLDGIGQMVALTSNAEVNALAALNFSTVFETSQIFQVATQSSEVQEAEGILPQHLRGRPLFSREITYHSLSHRFEAGAEVVSVPLEDGYDEAVLRRAYGPDMLPLFVITGPGDVTIYGDQAPPKPAAGQTLILLTDPDGRRDQLQMEREDAKPQQPADKPAEEHPAADPSMREA